MRRLIPCALLLLILPGVSRASNPIGIYALIDRVEFEPSDSQPERIQIWGVFSVAKKYDNSEGIWREYTTPMRGVMRFSLNKDKADLCRKEWADLKKVAGTGQCVTFGSRYEVRGAVTEDVDMKKDPPVYAINDGMYKIQENDEMSRHLRSVPAPLSPDRRGKIDTGTVTLKVANAPGKDLAKAKYIFEITTSTGQKETSAALEAGDKTTTWTPKMEIKPDVDYTWTVRVEADKYKGFPATSNFKGKAKP